jgi:hypothetical protein
MVMRGPSGEIRHGYQVAARLGKWEAMPRNETEMSFTASVVSVDEYWILQEPLEVALRLARTEWVWREVAPVRDGNQIHIVLKGKPEIERV